MLCPPEFSTSNKFHFQTCGNEHRLKQALFHESLLMILVRLNKKVQSYVCETVLQSAPSLEWLHSYPMSHLSSLHQLAKTERRLFQGIYTSLLLHITQSPLSIILITFFASFCLLGHFPQRWPRINTQRENWGSLIH